MFETFCNDRAIKHLKITPRWPQVNDEVERQNRSLEKRIKIAHSENLDWKKELQKYLDAYRSVAKPSIGKSHLIFFLVGNFELKYQQ